MSTRKLTPESPGPNQQEGIDEAAAALEFQATHGARAVNMSFGQNDNTLECPEGGALNLQLFCAIGQTCSWSDCVPKVPVTSATEPRAEAFIFTNDQPPAPGTPPLVPLYRLRDESDWSPTCPSPPDNYVSHTRDFAYATSEAEVEQFLNGITLGGTTYRYLLDGIEGYVYQDCSSGCSRGEVSLHRLYNSTRHDTVVVPSTKVATYQAQGYTVPAGSGLPEVIGWAYLPADGDDDGLVDGFERLLGTDPQDEDSDGDLYTDGAELLVYDRSDPDPALRGYRDPCSNGCPLFVDGFETGDTSAW